MGDNTDRYLRVLTWLPDGSELIVARYNRVLSSVELLAVDAVTREVRTIMPAPSGSSASGCRTWTSTASA